MLSSLQKKQKNIKKLQIFNLRNNKNNKKMKQQLDIPNANFVAHAKAVLIYLAKLDSDISVDYFTFIERNEGIHVYRKQTIGTYRLLIRYAVLKAIRDGDNKMEIVQFLNKYWCQENTVYEKCFRKVFSSFEIYGGLEYDILHHFILDDVRQICSTLQFNVISRLFIGQEAAKSLCYKPIDEYLLNRLLFLKCVNYYGYDKATRLSSEKFLKTGIHCSKNKKIFFGVYNSSSYHKWFLISDIWIYHDRLCPGIFDIGFQNGNLITITETCVFLKEAIDMIFEQIKGESF